MSDGDPCTDEVCNSGVCASEPNTGATCDDGDVCTENDACDAGTCAGTAVAGCCVDDTDCDTGEVCVDNACTTTCTDAADCPDDANPCTDRVCTNGSCGFDNNTATCDDGDACTENDACADGTCGGTDIADCCTDDADCDTAAGETCDTTTNTCVAAPPAGPSVTVSGCPATANQNDTAMVMATSSGFTAGGTVTYAWTSSGATFDPTDMADTTATLTGSGMVTLTNTATNTFVDDGGTPADTSDDTTMTETASGGCTIDVAFSPMLTCSAGNLSSARAQVGIYFSGNSLGSNATTGAINILQGAAVQQGFTSTVFSFQWSVASQPTGSGVITINTPTQATSSYTVGAPASAGTYAFDLLVTNTQTGETCTAASTLQLVDTPELQLRGTSIARRNVQGGNTVTLGCEYKATVPTTFNIYTKAAAPTTDANQVLLASASVAPSTGTGFSTVDIMIDTSVLPAGVATLLPGWQAVDEVGLTNANPVALTKANADESLANNRQSVLTVGAARTNTQIDAITTATATQQVEPPGIDLDDQVGAPVSIGNANPVDSINSTNVIYPGIGARGAGGDPGIFAHSANSMVFGKDLNGDGLSDILLGAGANLDVIFGNVANGTAGGADAGVAAGAAGQAANDDTVARQSWQAVGVFTAGVTAQLASGSTTVLDVDCADYNNDGQLDVAQVISAGGAAVGIARVTLLDSTLATTADPFTNSVSLSYTTDANGGAAGGQVDSGDFNGDGIVDACFGLPSEDDGASANTEGQVFCAYGKADTTTTLGSGLPASGVIDTVFEGTANGFSSRGTAAANSLWGQGLHVADISGNSSADLVFIKGLATANEVVVILGSVGDPADPAVDTGNVELGDATANDFAGGFITSGNLTGGAKPDLVVGFPNFDTGTSATGNNEGAVFVIPTSGLVTNADISAVPGAIGIRNLIAFTANNDLHLGFGSSASVLDFNGDGNNDLIVGHDVSNDNPGNSFLVYNGPLTAGTGINLNRTQNGANFRLDFTDTNAPGPFEGCFMADVNGDNVDDFVFVGAGWVGYMAGLE